MTKNQTATYQAALAEARDAYVAATKRLDEITEESNELTDEIITLRRTITALSALCSEAPGIDKMGITDACMEVMESATRELTTYNVVDELEQMGYDFSATKNPAASVHAVLSRLATREEIKKVARGNSIYWQGPKYKDPEEITDEDIPF